MNISDHTLRELAHAVRAGHQPGSPPPLERGAPVPGCVCLRCAVQRIGGGDEDVAVAERVVDMIANTVVDDRSRMARELVCATAAMLPAPDTLVRYATGSPRVPVVAIATEPTTMSTRTRRTLPVEDARVLPIMDVCDRLGLELKRYGKTWRGPCPIHGGEGPNFCALPDLNRFRCWTCGEHGDAIDLWQHVCGVDFPAAVLEMVA